ncbi:MAG TPA: hypothetical protein VIW67_22500 [Terriglobales bacterium]
MNANQQQPSRPRSRVYALEATGLLIIAALVLVLAVVRYWRHIPWSLR